MEAQPTYTYPHAHLDHPETWERVIAWHKSVPKVPRNYCSGWSLEKFEQELTKLKAFIAQCLGRCPSENGYWECSVLWWEMREWWIKSWQQELLDSFSTPPERSQQNYGEKEYVSSLPLNANIVRKRVYPDAIRPLFPTGSPPKKQKEDHSDSSTAFQIAIEESLADIKQMAERGDLEKQLPDH